MTAERWSRVKQILADALDIARDRRASFVDEACAGDQELRQEVLTLLRGDEPDSNFLNLDRAPQMLGAWRVVRELGRGGMGTVYLADRADGQFEQRAAIKVIKRGMDTDAVLRRFYAERQILARLQHPNITRLLDGGLFDGRPYFVMEYLEGEPILDYCRRRALPLKDRVNLFLSVCDAVDYAHRNLILHRDLKGGNILVDTGGVAKLLDFGIAKLLTAEGAAEQTILPVQAFTPQAASPEQVKGDPLTTASDVYALGLLLFELLAGKPPYRVQANLPAEMVDIICERPVPRPSLIAESAYGRALPGDLDTIVLKALEKDPTRRYNRAADMADDLRRYLDGLPIQARPTSAGYRLHKFVSRHRRPVAVAAALVLAVTVAVTDAVREGRRASRRFQELRQLAGNFLFEFHDAIASLPGATPARELVEKRALQYLDILSREASSDLDLKRELAEGYVRIGAAQGLTHESNLGKSAEARASIDKAIALLDEVSRARPNDAAVTADLARAHLARLSTGTKAESPQQHLAELRKVASMLEESAKQRPLTAPAHLTLAQAYFGLGEVLWVPLHQDSDSLAARLRSIALLEDLVRRFPQDPDGPRWLAQSKKRLAAFYLTELHQPAQAAGILRETTQIDELRLARDPASATVKLDLALDRDYLGTALWAGGDRLTGMQLVEQATAERAQILDADPHNYRVRYLLLTDYVKLAKWLRQQNQASEAHAVVLKGLSVAAGVDAQQANDREAAAAVSEIRRLASDSRQ
ncbi:MAG TPA: serine/threonine-protein kinase [Bryobacteraceae bacterium]|nr:serine/threonine-protein kinase [Bryobacteraceae bacterium]